jgi:hypothetical protein
VVTGITQDVQINSIYLPQNVALTTFQLPAVCAVGDRVSVAGFGSGGWIILNGAGQSVHIAGVATANTSIASASRYDSIDLICVEDNLTWTTLGAPSSAGLVVI